MQQNLHPVIKWAGSKYRQTEVYEMVQKFYEPYSHLTFVEIFAGGLGMTYRIQPVKATLYDLNYHLMAFYKSIQSRIELFDFDLIDGAPYELLVEKYNTYLTIDDIDELVSDRMFATVFYLINQKAFNGLYRVSGKNKFNVPEGKRAGMKSAFNRMHPDLYEHQMILKNWQFNQSNAFDSMRSHMHDPDCFMYCDPPYIGSEVSYSSSTFPPGYHLAMTCLLSEATCPIVISNAANYMMIQQYERLGFDVHFISEKRKISANGDRSPASCIIATKNI